MKFILPKNVYKEISKLELNTALFCNSLYGKKEIAGLMLFLNDDIFIHFGIDEEEFKRFPDFKLRMLNLEKKNISF